MSQIAKNENFGKNINVVMTHHGGNEILGSTVLYPNSLIISAPTNGEYDYDSYSLLATDYLGNPVRLTYTLKEGNGLVAFDANSSYDVMSLEIDHDSIDSTYNGYALQLVKTNVIDNNTLAVYQAYNESKTRIKVVTANLDKATDVNYGIVKGDNTTISTVNGLINVNTENLQYVDDTTNKSGIVRFNPDIVGDYDWRTVEANNGVLHVVTKNLDIASEEQVGVVKPDMLTTLVEQQTGRLRVLTAGLDKATETSYGIVRSDNKTTEIVNGQIVAHPEYMTGATTSSFGVIKLDENSLEVDETGYTRVKRWGEIVNILNNYVDHYNYIIKWLVDHENRITALENMAAAEYIYSFNNYGTSTTELEKPYWNGTEVISEVEYHTAVFSINTNCPFNVSFEFEDQTNVTPQITLQSVKLGETTEIDASELQNHTFASTNSNESTLSFKFRCENYTSSTDEDSTMTIVKLKVSSINDSSIYKIGSHIFVRWNEAKYVVPAVEPTITETTTAIDNYTYYGPYFQYWTNNALKTKIEHALSLINRIENDERSSNSVLNIIDPDGIYPKQNTETELIAAIEDVRNTARGNYDNVSNTISTTVSAEQQNGTLLQYGYAENLGEYALVGAYTGNRTSYSFMFHTMKIVQKDHVITTTKYDENNNVVDTQVSTTISYSLENMSSPIETASNSQFAGRITMGHPQYSYRDMNYEGISEDHWVASFDGSWVSANVSALASNTGNYNVMTISSVTPLEDEDRMASFVLQSAASSLPSIYKTPTEDTNIDKLVKAFDITDNIKFTLIEDIYEHKPNVHVDIELLNNADNPLRITVNRSVNSTLREDASNWGVIIKFYYLTTSEPIGVDIGYANIIADRGAGNSGSSDNILNNGEFTDKAVRTSLDNVQSAQAAPIILKININKAKYSYEWNAYDDSTGKNSIIPKSVMDILSGPGANNISGITIDSITAFGFNYGGSSDSGLRTASEPSQVLVEKNDNITVTYSISGTWPTSSVQPSNRMSFGNASVTAITVHPWTTNEFDIDFVIRPGDHTTVYEDSTIASIGDLRAVLYVDNVPYDCDIKIADDSRNEKWTTTGYTLKTRIYNIHTDVAQQQTDRGGQSNDRGSQTSHNQTNVNGLDYISGIKVYFKLTAIYSGMTCTLNYATGTNGNLTDKILVDVPWNIGLSRSVSITNALYNANPGTTISQEEQNQTSVQQMAEMLAQLQERVDELENNNTEQTLSDK